MAFDVRRDAWARIAMEGARIDETKLTEEELKEAITVFFDELMTRDKRLDFEG